MSCCELPEKDRERRWPKPTMESPKNDRLGIFFYCKPEIKVIQSEHLLPGYIYRAFLSRQTVDLSLPAIFDQILSGGIRAHLRLK